MAAGNKKVMQVSYTGKAKQAKKPAKKVKATPAGYVKVTMLVPKSALSKTK